MMNGLRYIERAWGFANNPGSQWVAIIHFNVHEVELVFNLHGIHWVFNPSLGDFDPKISRLEPRSMLCVYKYTYICFPSSVGSTFSWDIDGYR